MDAMSITDQEFIQFQRFIYDAAGISMSSGKKALVSGRLAKRVRQCNLSSYGEYFRLLASGDAPAEVQTAVDLLTTNETYFFREPKHFDTLREHALAARRRVQTFRVWSAACSTGEEPYSIAMVLADCLANGLWEVLGSDISTRVLQRACTGHYPTERTGHIPPSYLQRFCLKGVGEQQGTLLVARSLRAKVQFMQVNLNAPLPQLGMFDAIFLRNVMIYFNAETKRQVVSRVLSQLKPGGIFCIGHSESLNDITDAVQAIAPSIYRKR
ncbi:CheR family methyltransferase [Noviherbaspirillum sedimenti]|uniref:Chemotaxis protein methyltransferase n=1 Tax=Noviherbaspirillum sedimenti TaxID=2320865 RepID=A0A3A3FZU4_9BURK|nr:protein-glutamate O-methyltransferase CheR [Noviherbaspirillum sedimenti]RJG01194.1 protein-glutamate O-methyltransferase CheR [Noviherbaspirillum sedimenti]